MDEGFGPLQAIDGSVSEEPVRLEKGFTKIENIQIPETGGIIKTKIGFEDSRGKEFSRRRA
jgi:hypothetical protein